MSMPEPLPDQPKKNNTGMIIAVVVIILCCCCVLILVGGWYYGDNIMKMLPAGTGAILNSLKVS
jgi:hypothetical protein